MKNRFIIVIILAALFSGYCVNSENTKNKVSITYWSQGAYKATAYLETIIAHFEEKNPNIKVNLEGVDEVTFKEKVDAVKAGTTKRPDVIETNLGNLLYAMDTGWLDARSATEVISTIDENKFAKNPIDWIKIDNQFIAVPLLASIQTILWYRGDKISETPNSWEKLKTAAATQSGKIIIPTSKTNAPDFVRQVFTGLAIANGTMLFDNNGNPNFNTQGIIDTINLYKDLASYRVDGNWADDKPKGVYWQDRDLYQNGSATMMFYSASIMDDLVVGSNDGDGNLVTPIEGLAEKTKAVSTFTGPNNDIPAGDVVPIYMGISASDSLKKAAAKELIIFILTEKYIDFLHLQPGAFIPVIEGIAENSEFKNNDVLKRFDTNLLGALFDAVDNGTLWPLNPDNTVNEKWGTITANKLIAEPLSEFMQNPTATAAEVAEEIQSKICAKVSCND
jgi:ABC-type glycerol-3-phosphate transport system substrate-binding protein